MLRIVRNLAIFNGAVILLIGGYAYFSRDAMERDHSPVAYIGSRCDTGGIARDIHACDRARSSRSGEAWASFRRGSPPWMKRQP